jgi:mono/diheme cytochrome c family protein
MRHALFAIAAALSLGACTTEEAPPRAAPLTMAEAAQGQRIAETNCSSCHAIGPDGASPHSLAPPFRTFSRNYPIHSLEEAFAEGVLVGHPDMPEFRLEPDQVDALIAYIYTVQEEGSH